MQISDSNRQSEHILVMSNPISILICVSYLHHHHLFRVISLFKLLRWWLFTWMYSADNLKEDKNVTVTKIITKGWILSCFNHTFKTITAADTIISFTTYTHEWSGIKPGPLSVESSHNDQWYKHDDKVDDERTRLISIAPSSLYVNNCHSIAWRSSTHGPTSTLKAVKVNLERRVPLMTLKQACGSRRVHDAR